MLDKNDNRNVKFKSHFKIFSREDAKKATNIIASPSFINYKQVVEDYLRILRKRYTDENIFSLNNLQYHLLLDIIGAERTIKDYKKHVKTLNIEKDKVDIDYFNREIDLNILFRSKLKDVGDALAWKIFNYDRSILYLFSDNQDSGFLQPEGLVNEVIAWLSEYYNEGRLSVLNCVTNCLRIGDVVSKDKDGKIDVFEIKSGAKSARKKRKKQTEIMDELINILNNKVLNKNNREYRIIETSFYPQNYYRKLNDLISQGYGRGYGAIKLNDFSFINIFNYEKITDMEIVIEEMDKLTNKYKEGWDNRTHMFNNHIRFDFSPISAPYSIFPFNELICSDLMFGKIHLSYIINFTKFEKYIESQNIRIIQKPEDIIKSSNKPMNYLYEFGFKDYFLKIPPMMLNRMLFEFGNEKVIVKEFFALRDAIEKSDSPFVFLTNTKENQIWK